jgi:hypothetical protein
LEDAADVGTTRHPLLTHGGLIGDRLCVRFLGSNGLGRVNATLHYVASRLS